MKNWLPFAQLVRLPNTFTAMADIFLGAAATGLLFKRWHVFLCLLVSSTLLYWSGMIWNDYFDVAEDARDRPGRPLPSGRISLRGAFGLAACFMILGIAFALGADLLNANLPDAERVSEGGRFVSWRATTMSVLLVVAILLYDAMLKETFIGPIVMGMCRSLNILLGLAILDVLPPFWGWLMALIIGIYIAGVTWFAQTETQKSRQPILIAAAIVILISLVLALTVPALALETPGGHSPSAFFPYLLAAFGGYLGMAVVRAIRRPDPMRVQPVIKRAILGLIVLDALLASAFVGSFGLLLAVLLIPGMILGRWLYST
jgi:4-hydroxybenzoate polyprenyltransferase